MLESFKAAGLDPIVIDENTDFSKLVVAAEPGPNVFDSMFINGEAWRATGVWLTEQFETRYAKD